MDNSVKYRQLLPLWKFLHRYHVILFVVVVLGSLAVATFFLYRTIIDSGDVSDTTVNSGFDQATIQKINQLKNIDEQEASSATAPKSARNPFTE